MKRTDKDRRDAHCLISFAFPVPRLYFFHFGIVNLKWGPMCQKITTKVVAGDNVNAAIFWSERYYRRVPVRELIPLAAHLVISAGKLNRGAISGLEIVSCDGSGIRRMSDESTRELEEAANELDKSIGDLFLNHRQKFSYAPNVIR